MSDNIVVKKLTGASGKLVKNSFTRTKHNFKGWSTDSSATTPTYTDEQNLTFTTDLDLYAVWKKYYDITFDVTDATVQTKPQDQKVEDGDTFILPVCEATKSGYYFCNWIDTENLEESLSYNVGNTITPTADCNFKAYFKQIVTVHYNLNGGTGTAPADQKINSNSGVVLSDCTATKTDAVFGGWATSATATAKSYNAGQTLLNTFSNSIYNLYAFWVAQYVVKFAWNYSGTTVTDSTDFTVGANEEVTAPASSTDYIDSDTEDFGGWSTYTSLSDQLDNDVIEGSTTLTPTASITYYCVKVPKYKITFNIDGGTGTVPDTIYVSRGSSFTVPSSSCTKEHYVNSGWTCGSSTYTANQTVTPTGDMVMSVNWVAQKCVTLKSNNSDNTTTTEWLNSGSKFTVPSCTNTDSSVEFAGWSTSSTATTGTYFEDDKITVTSDLTLYAVWNSTIRSTIGATQFNLKDKDIKCVGQPYTDYDGVQHDDLCGFGYVQGTEAKMTNVYKTTQNEILDTLNNDTGATNLARVTRTVTNMQTGVTSSISNCGVGGTTLDYIELNNCTDTLISKIVLAPDIIIGLSSFTSSKWKWVASGSSTAASMIYSGGSSYGIVFGRGKYFTVTMTINDNGTEKTFTKTVQDTGSYGSTGSSWHNCSGVTEHFDPETATIDFTSDLVGVHSNAYTTKLTFRQGTSKTSTPYISAIHGIVFYKA